MFVPFESVSPTARLWIYQSGRKFTVEDKKTIHEFLKSFTEIWAAHGQPLKTSFDIRYDHFIILAADEDFNAASGCSIDESSRTIKDLGQRLSVDLFDRSSVAFQKNGDIIFIPLSDLRQKYVEHIWNEATPAFNNLIAQKSQLNGEWIIPAGNTWLKRYVPVINVAP
jgi:hypothetical protein